MGAHRLAAYVLLVAGGVQVASAAEATRLLRFPDLHRGRVVFTYANDVWIGSTHGGSAARLTTLAANKFGARFSPDGRWLAFTAERGGNYDVFVAPSTGGDARRLTWHPMPDFAVGWTRDGASVLFRSRRTSFTHPVDHLFSVPMAGGAPIELPIANGGPASYSPAGNEIVYTSNPPESWNPWRGYRGGRHAQLAVYDLTKHTQYDLAPSDANDSSPTWVGRTIYFASDRDGRTNLYAFDTESRSLSQLTHERESDVRYPSVTADGRAIYAKDGELHVLDLVTRRDTTLHLTPAGDFPERHRRQAGVAPYVTSFEPAAEPGKALVSARGEVFTIDSTNASAKNLSATSGARELSATSSADGRWLAYVSDATGEYEIYVRSMPDGAVRRITHDGHGYRDGLRWSPDGRMLLFVDETQSLYVLDVASGTPRRVDRSANAPIEQYQWLPDSGGVVYAKVGDNRLGRLYRFDVGTRVTSALTDGMTDDFDPVVDATGTGVYFLSARNLRTSFSDFEQTFNFNDTVGIYHRSLETGEGATGRVSRLPVDASSLSHLVVAGGELLYVQRDRRSGALSLHAFDVAARHDRTVASEISDYASRGATLIIRRGNELSWQPLAGETGAKYDLGALTMSLDPVAEWRQIFAEVWRLERDYFYDPTLHGVDWPAVRRRYEVQLPSVATREDLNFLLTQLVAELGTSHSWVVGGDTRGYDSPPVGVLGADLVPDGRRYRIARVYAGDPDSPSPLGDVGVVAGSLLVAIAGKGLTTDQSLEERLDGSAGREVTMTIEDPNGGRRDVTATPVGNDMPLRYAGWVAANRARVLAATEGRCGYVHVPNTGGGGIAAFARQLLAQVDKEALIVDIRWNAGGLFPAAMIERLRRVALARESSRHGNDLRIPGVAVEGPKVLLANQNTISGGDSFAIYFRVAEIGPIVGTRTAGATVGNVGMPGLIDGGEAAVAALAYWEPDGAGGSRWAVENVGVAPDVEVREAFDTTSGTDPQMDKAIEVVRDRLRAMPPRPARPSFPGQREP